MKKYLSKDYVVVSIDFQLLSHSNFVNEAAFVRAFSRELVTTMDRDCEVPDETKIVLKSLAVDRKYEADLGELFYILSNWCSISDKPVVLMIDEVDSATNNQVFLDFLAQLRGYYIHRIERATFQSVILAGVYDSPWNIATDFEVNMNFTAKDIAGMLQGYEDDYHTGMDIGEMAGLIWDYTSGYPFLVTEKVP